MLELLHVIWLDAPAHVDDRAHGDQVAVGSPEIVAFEPFLRQPETPCSLRNDLVAPTFQAEPVCFGFSQHDLECLPDVPHGYTQSCGKFTVDAHTDFGSRVAQILGNESKNSRLPRGSQYLISDTVQLAIVRVG